jgi:hypothetical protein
MRGSGHRAPSWPTPKPATVPVRGARSLSTLRRPAEWLTATVRHEHPNADALDIDRRITPRAAWRLWLRRDRDMLPIDRHAVDPLRDHADSTFRNASLMRCTNSRSLRAITTALSRVNRLSFFICMSVSFVSCS